MLIGRRGFLAGLGSLLAAPAIVSSINLMPVSAKLIVPTKYDLIVVSGQNQFGQLVEEKLFDTSENNILERFSGFKDIREVRKMQSIVRPWDEHDYGLRADIENSIQQLGG